MPNKKESFDALFDRFVMRVFAEKRNRLLKELEDKDFDNMVDRLRAEQVLNKGWSHERTRRHIASIPPYVYKIAEEIFGPEDLKNKKTFKKIFRKWLIVPESSI